MTPQVAERRTPQVAPRRTPPADRFDRRLLPSMMFGAILNPINSSIIAVALVPIGVAFGAPASQTAWLVSALYLATAIGQPLIGRFVDSYGARRMFLIGAAFTLVAGVVGTLAPSIWVLVAARVILGFGTCAGYPAAMALIRGEAERTGITSPAGVLSALSITTQAIAVVGPPLGGVLIGVGGWRSTIGINIVLGAACLVLGWRYLPARRPATDAPPAPTPRVDVLGILLFATTLVALLLYLMMPQAAPRWLLLLAVGGGVAFARWELRTTNPFIEVRVVAGNVPLLTTYVRAFLASTVSYSFIYGFTQWVEQGRGLTPAIAGLILLPTFAVSIVVTALTGRRSEIRLKLVVGAIGQVVACVLMLLVGSSSPIWLLLVIVTVLGLPQGLVSLANQNAVYHQARPDMLGASAGLLRTFMYVGAMVASAGTGFFFGPRATTPGLRGLGWFMLVVAAAFLVITLLDRAVARVGRDDDETRQPGGEVRPPAFSSTSRGPGSTSANVNVPPAATSR